MANGMSMTGVNVADNAQQAFASGERLLAEARMKAWSIEVRRLVEDMLMLGRTFDVEVSIPSGMAAKQAVELEDFGFSASNFMDTNLIQVMSAVANPTGVLHFPQSPFATMRGQEIKAIASHDYLVGINGTNLLLFPMSLPHVRRELQMLLANGASRVKLQFVRWEKLVCVDPLLGRTHGQVLLTLDQIDRALANMRKRYEELLDFNRFWVSKKLHRESKLMRFLRSLVVDTRNSVMADERFKFAWRFIDWCDKLDDSTHKMFAKMSLSSEPSAADAAPTAGDKKVVRSTFSIPPPPPPPTAPPVQQNSTPKVSVNPPSKSPTVRAPNRQIKSILRTTTVPPPSAAPQYRVDNEWVDYFPAADLKWLPKAKSVLSTFMVAINESFAADEPGPDADVAHMSRHIAEQLVKMYVVKRRTQSGDNTAFLKEFARHVRMLRSNLKIPENRPLRADLLSGALTVTQLCEMSSDDLAPAALQKERQKRYEQHTQNVMIKEPTGNLLVKTKHGYRELNLGGSDSPMDTEVSPPVVNASSEPASTLTSASTDAPSDPHPPGITSENRSADHSNSAVAEKEAPAADTEKVTELLKNVEIVKKRVSFTENVVSGVNEVPKTLPPPPPVYEGISLDGKMKPAPNARWVSMVEARTFLDTLFSPMHDLVGLTQQFVRTVESAPIATMSNEFNLAQGVTLHRRSTADNTLMFHVQVQIAHLYCESHSHNQRHANVEAVNRLANTVANFKRLFADLLHQLNHDFRVAQTTLSHDEAAKHLSDKKIIRIVIPPPRRSRQQANVSEYDCYVVLDTLILGRSTSSNPEQAKKNAIHDFMAYIASVARILDANELAQEPNNASCRKSQEIPRPDVSIPTSRQRNDNTDATPQIHHYHHHIKELSEPRQYDHNGSGPHKPDPYGTEYSEAHWDRKRQRDPSSETQEPQSSRRRIENENPPVFICDTKGETKPAKPVQVAASTVLMQGVRAYQEFVRMAFKDRNGLEGRLKAINWDTGKHEEIIELSPQLSITRTIEQLPSKHYSCHLKTPNTTFSGQGRNLDLELAASEAVKSLMKCVDNVSYYWGKLLKTYLDRKGHTPTTLMAGNETRQKNQNLVKTSERTAGHLLEYRIYVSDVLAVRHACYTARDAKRSASEEFRDLMEYLAEVSARSSQRQSSTSSASSSQHSERSSSASSARAPQPPPQQQKPKPRHAQVVMCSEDEDDDDDQSDYSLDDDSDGGAPSENASNPRPKPEINSRAEFLRREMEIPYDVGSERAGSVDARFRATLRSLFTPTDELCEGIQALRGSLKYQGAAEKTITQNVRASIRMERLREGVFKMRVSVNEIVYFEATHDDKTQAINDAINGVLDKLNGIRRVWVMLLNFLHTKALGTTDLLESFHALQLANIARIAVSVEKPESYFGRMAQRSNGRGGDIQGVLSVDGYTLFRAGADLETDARDIVTCRSAKFFANLIEGGLLPPEDDVDMSKDEITDEVGTKHDWSCLLRVQDFGERSEQLEFRVDGKWIYPYTELPTPDFGTSNLVLAQRNAIRMGALEHLLETNHPKSLMFFSVESAYDQTKLVKAIATYGNKNSKKAFALEFQFDSVESYEVYVIPPGASINSQQNLYFPEKRLPKEMQDRKVIYGFLKKRK